jgi:hypothetical protein
MAKVEKKYFGKKCWQDQLKAFTIQLEKVATNDNPAMELYMNDMRTNCFKLQGLARLFKRMHNKKRFEKMQIQFKQLEDLFGALDFYLSTYGAWKTNKKIPQAAVNWLNERVTEKENTLSIFLKQEYLLSSKTLAKITEKIESADWLEDQEEGEELEAIYQEEILKTLDFMDDHQMPFTQMEEQVHELRRKLRWLSIYPQVLDGRMQLKQAPKANTALKKYQTKEVLASPFNELPKSKGQKRTVHIDQASFYALSFVITALGAIKDEGLSQHLLVDALLATKQSTAKNAATDALKMLGQKRNEIQLLADASSLIDAFEKSNVLATQIVE